MDADQKTLDLIQCGRGDCCGTTPCAWAQSIVDAVVAQVLARLEDHYWDSLADRKDLILNHVKGALQVMPKGPAGDRGQVGWMGGEFDR
jgi:hypothetical protein